MDWGLIIGLIGLAWGSGFIGYGVGFQAGATEERMRADDLRQSARVSKEDFDAMTRR